MLTLKPQLFHCNVNFKTTIISLQCYL